jgi:hypothetical protein
LNGRFGPVALFENDHASSLGTLASCGHLLHAHRVAALIL